MQKIRLVSQNSTKDVIHVNVQMVDGVSSTRIKKPNIHEIQKKLPAVIHVDEEAHQTARTARNEMSVIRHDDLEVMDPYYNNKESHKESVATIVDASPMETINQFDNFFTANKQQNHE